MKASPLLAFQLSCILGFSTEGTIEKENKGSIFCHSLLHLSKSESLEAFMDADGIFSGGGLLFAFPSRFLHPVCNGFQPLLVFSIYSSFLLVTRVGSG